VAFVLDGGVAAVRAVDVVVVRVRVAHSTGSEGVARSSAAWSSALAIRSTTC
jgi:hypothetical protein